MSQLYLCVEYWIFAEILCVRKKIVNTFVHKFLETLKIKLVIHNKGGGEVEAKELKRIQGGGGNGFIRRR